MKKVAGLKRSKSLLGICYNALVKELFDRTKPQRLWNLTHNEDGEG